MHKEFMMSMIGELTYSMGFRINQKEDTIIISQIRYARNLVKKFSLENSSHKRTPVATHAKVTKCDVRTNANITMYHTMTGSLLYLTASRPDIAFDVEVCA